MDNDLKHAYDDAVTGEAAGLAMGDKAVD